MRRHGPSCDEDDKARDEVALGGAVSALAQPNSSKAGAPPNDAHGRVLPVIPDPFGSPSVLSEGVDTTPCSNNGAVEELLAAASPTEPNLTNEQHDGKEDAVCDEGTAHDEVSGTLSQVITLAKAQ